MEAEFNQETEVLQGEEGEGLGRLLQAAVIHARR